VVYLAHEGSNLSLMLWCFYKKSKYFFGGRRRSLRDVIGVSVDVCDMSLLKEKIPLDGNHKIIFSAFHHICVILVNQM
jgi:hypothetical protein